MPEPRSPGRPRRRSKEATRRAGLEVSFKLLGVGSGSVPHRNHAAVPNAEEPWKRPVKPFQLVAGNSHNLEVRIVIKAENRLLIHFSAEEGDGPGNPRLGAVTVQAGDDSRAPLGVEVQQGDEV